MKTLTPITDATVINPERNEPADAWNFGKAVQYNQTRDIDKLHATHKILFNKGRYFETSLYDKDLRDQVSELTGIPVTHNVMIVASWKKLEEFVLAMNCFGIYVNIDIDWI